MRDVNFFETAAGGGHIGDPGIEYAGDAGEFIDDLIGEFVRNPAEILDAAGVALANALLVLKNIEEPQFNCHLVALNGKAAFDEPFSANCRPIFEIERS